MRTEKLTKHFGGLTAVQDVNFNLENGETQAVIGPNGAGKSTFFKLIIGELKPTYGRVWFNGKDITGSDQNLISRKGIGTSYQITNIFPKLTAFENVRIAAQSRVTSYNMWSKAERLGAINGKTEEILKRIGLLGKENMIARNLSYGDQRRLELAIALGTSPMLLLLDEPTSGLSPRETLEIVDIIKEISKDLSIILVEHKMKVVMDLSDIITVFHEGSIIAKGSPQEIRENNIVRKVYLGGVATC